MVRSIKHRAHRDHRVRNIFLCALCVLCVKIVLAQEWHTGEGLVTMANITPEQAHADALNIARQDALHKAGIEIRGVTARHIREANGGERYDEFASFTRTVTRGRIVDEEILFDDQVKIAEVWHYRVELRAQIEMDVGKPDPMFKLDIKLNQQAYRDGETITVMVSSTRDCYVTLFNLFADDSLCVIFPNQYYTNNEVHGEEHISIPPPDAGWDLPVSLNPGKVEDIESILAVATKDDIPFFSPGATIRNELISVSDALTAINKWLLDIPSDRRTEDIIHYKIIK